jgi:HTH-type transcriptional regulator/antitoxin HigA
VRRIIMIEPVADQESHLRALRRIEMLWNTEPGSPEERELDALATLVDAYERKCFPILPLDPVQAIKVRCEQLGWTRKDLEPILGSRARVSEVLGGQTRADPTDDSQGSGLEADPRRRSYRSSRGASERHEARRLMEMLRMVPPNKGLQATALRAAPEAQGVGRRTGQGSPPVVFALACSPQVTVGPEPGHEQGTILVQREAILDSVHA